ncbi:PDZ domain-containing protein 9, partial [Ambystoma mexicanum]|uniref:PDZ domain-containing protein 9 n=1 Tax=Ambystoma mexicanum TaxID=8296 RepID=UPI0037E7835C
IPAHNTIYFPVEAPQEVTSEHTLSTTLKTYLSLDADGLGLALIQNGPYLQIVDIVENGAAARNGRLKPGDILIKIGHANVLGCTLREVRQMLARTPIGTALQIMVYRDLVDVPQEWEAESPSQVPPTPFPSKEKDAWTSSEEEEDEDINLETNFRHVMATKSFWYDSSTELPPVSKYWHSVNKNTRILTVGQDIGCDVMIHRSFKTGKPFGTEETQAHVTSDITDSSGDRYSPYWTMVDDVASLSTSSSSGSDAFWMDECAVPFN